MSDASMPAAPQAAQLTLRAGGVAVAAGGRSILVVGADPACDLVVAGHGVARRHVVLRNEHGVWVVEDLSDGQTFLDGQPVSRLAVLAALELTLGSAAGGVHVVVDPVAEMTQSPTPAWPLAAPRASAATEASTRARDTAAMSPVNLSALRVRLPYVLLVAVVGVPALLQALGH